VYTPLCPTHYSIYYYKLPVLGQIKTYKKGQLNISNVITDTVIHVELDIKYHV